MGERVYFKVVGGADKGWRVSFQDCGNLLVEGADTFSARGDDSVESVGDDNERGKRASGECAGGVCKDGAGNCRSVREGSGERDDKEAHDGDERRSGF